MDFSTDSWVRVRIEIRNRRLGQGKRRNRKVHRAAASGGKLEKENQDLGNIINVTF